MKKILSLSFMFILLSYMSNSISATPTPCGTLLNKCSIFSFFDHYVTLKASTAVDLELDQTIDFNTISAGSSTLRFTTKAQVKVDEDVVIGRNAYAVGRVKAFMPATAIERARIVIELTHVYDVNGEPVDLKSSEEVIFGESNSYSGIVNSGAVMVRAQVAHNTRVRIP